MQRGMNDRKEREIYCIKEGTEVRCSSAICCTQDAGVSAIQKEASVVSRPYGQKAVLKDVPVSCKLFAVAEW